MQQFWADARQDRTCQFQEHKVHMCRCQFADYLPRFKKQFRDPYSSLANTQHQTTGFPTFSSFNHDLTKIHVLEVGAHCQPQQQTSQSRHVEAHIAVFPANGTTEPIAASSKCTNVFTNGMPQNRELDPQWLLSQRGSTLGTHIPK